MIVKIDKLVIEGYIARDKDGELIFHNNKPSKFKGFWISNANTYLLPCDCFADSKCEDEPEKVELIISKIQKL